MEPKNIHSSCTTMTVKLLIMKKGDNTLLELKVTKGKDGKLKGQSNFINNKKYTYGKINWLWMSN